MASIPIAAARAAQLTAADAIMQAQELMQEADELMGEAGEPERDEREQQRDEAIATAGGLHLKAIETLRQGLGDHSRVSELKVLLVRAHLRGLECEIHVGRMGPDEAASVAELIGKFDQAVRSYKVRNQLSLWTDVEQAFERWERESRNQGRDYEAAVFGYQMLRARKYRVWAEKAEWGQKNWPEIIKLGLLDALFGFGYHLGKTLRWVVAAVAVFALIYAALAQQLTSAPPTVDFTRWFGLDGCAGVACRLAALPLDLLSRFLGLLLRLAWGLWFSIAVLFIPEMVNLQQDGVVRAIIAANRLLAYAVNVGLIAIVVNKLAARRKW